MSKHPAQETFSETEPLTHSPKPLSFPLNVTPTHVHPYLELMRMDKPTGTWLVFLAYSWGVTMAAHHIRMDLAQYAIELVKALAIAFLIRSYGCTINDICDYELDRHVERCKTRPLASGRISYTNACIFAGAQILICLGFFYVSLNTLGFMASVFQLLFLTSSYPLMKRITNWPQAWLGIAVSFGTVSGWLSVSGELDCLFIGMLLTSVWSWTILYDTIYACQDKADDIKAGVRSTAILFGSWIRPLLTMFGLVFAGTLSFAGILNQQGVGFAVSLAATVAHLGRQYATVNLDDPKSCKVNFVQNVQLGWLVMGGLVVDLILDKIVLSSTWAGM